MAQEWRLLRSYEAAWQGSPYPPVFVTVDSVVRCAGHVLLVRRGQAPGLGLLALPGGFIEPRDTTLQSALRELDEETHLGVPRAVLLDHLAGRAVFDHPDRSQRVRTITHGFFFDLPGSLLPAVEAGDDAAGAAWVPQNQLHLLEDQFLDDHFHILAQFLGGLSGLGG
jgi:bifunctional NMN adenylyltransferase/nudix hydrolase